MENEKEGRKVDKALFELDKAVESGEEERISKSMNNLHSLVGSENFPEIFLQHIMGSIDAQTITHNPGRN